MFSRHLESYRVWDIGKYYLTLEELHPDDLRTNRGFIMGARPIRLPTWE
jgi:hypothetical protein